MLTEKTLQRYVKSIQSFEKKKQAKEALEKIDFTIIKGIRVTTKNNAMKAFQGANATDLFDEFWRNIVQYIDETELEVLITLANNTDNNSAQ